MSGQQGATPSTGPGGGALQDDLGSVYANPRSGVTGPANRRPGGPPGLGGPLPAYQPPHSQLGQPPPLVVYPYPMPPARTSVGLVPVVQTNYGLMVPTNSPMGNYLTPLSAFFPPPPLMPMGWPRSVPPQEAAEFDAPQGEADGDDDASDEDLPSVEAEDEGEDENTGEDGGQGVQPPQPVQANVLDFAQVVSQPARVPFRIQGLSDQEIARGFCGKTPNQLAQTMSKGSVQASVDPPSKKSRLAKLVRAKGLRGRSAPVLTELHYGGGVHGGAYIRISTHAGKIKIVDPATYQAKGEKNVHYILVSGLIVPKD